MNPFDTLNSPSMLHAAVVHFPVVLATLGLPMIIASAVFDKNRTLRVVTLLTLVLLTASSYVAEETGEGAYEKVPNDLPAHQWNHVDEHERLGELMKFFGGGTAIIFAFSFIPTPVVRKTAVLLGAAGGIACSILVAVTAHQGGHLVYEYGIGTKLMEEGAQPPGSAAEADEAEEQEELVAIRDFTDDEAKAVSYTRDIVPLMNNYCTDCHEDGDESDGGWDCTTVANMMKAGEKAGAGVIPGDPDNSSMVKYIRGELQPRMPKRKPPLPEDELHLIRMWIAAGAVDDSDTVAAPEDEAPAADPFATPAAPVEEAPAADPFATPAEPEPAPEVAEEPAEEPEAPMADPFAVNEEAPAAEPEEDLAPEAPVTDPFAAPAEESEPETPMADPFAAPAEEPAAEEEATPVDPFAAEEPAEEMTEEEAPEEETPEPAPSPVPGEAESEADPFVMPKETSAQEPAEQETVDEPEPKADEPEQPKPEAPAAEEQAVEPEASEPVAEEAAPADDTPVTIEEVVKADPVEMEIVEEAPADEAPAPEEPASEEAPAEEAPVEEPASQS